MRKGDLIIIGASTAKEWEMAVQKYADSGADEKTMLKRIRQIQVETTPEKKWETITKQIEAIEEARNVKFDTSLIEIYKKGIPDPNPVDIVDTFDTAAGAVVVEIKRKGRESNIVKFEDLGKNQTEQKAPVQRREPKKNRFLPDWLKRAA